MGKKVEFGEDDLSATKLARMVQLHMAQYVIEKSGKLKREKGRKKSVFENYIKVMKKLLDANKESEKLGLWLSLYAWMVISGVMFLGTRMELNGVCKHIWRASVDWVNMLGLKLCGASSWKQLRTCSES